jgi:predicted O-methyltransferase YrrM
MSEFSFTNQWFDTVARRGWDELIPQFNPTKILEIGSYEGASTCYLIDKLKDLPQPLDIHCVDSWEGGEEHVRDGTDMGEVEARFQNNVRLAVERAGGRASVVAHKGYSDMALASMLATGRKNYFDFAYIDGSHQAPDVLCDAVLAFKLVRVGGVIAFDDYVWAEAMPYGKDPLRCPKPAIDAFVNIHFRKVQILSPTVPLYQLYIQKLSD